MGLKDLLTGRLARSKTSDALLERAEREFARGENSAGVAILLELSEGGDPQVFFRIGECYETAKGVIPNFATALSWLQQRSRNWADGREN